MPTILTHPAVPLALGLGLGRDVISTRLLLAGIIVADLPDLDVIAFRFGIPYGAPFGHRGFTHSLTFAAFVAAIGALAARGLNTTPLTAFVFLFVATASHGLLDCVTNGGMGIALFWPFSSERYFAPYQWIEVAPIGVGPFFSRRGLSVLVSELLFVWVPCAILAAALATFSHRAPGSRAATGEQSVPSGT
jgi:inner membrane protein